MAKYKYLVFDQSAKEIEGYIDAGTLEEARERLNQYGFSVLQINEVQALDISQYLPEGHVVFIFEAYDSAGKNIKGTIEDVSVFAAFRRLYEEYGFKITRIYPESAGQTERDASVEDVLRFIEQIAQEKRDADRAKLPLLERILVPKEEDNSADRKALQDMIEKVVTKSHTFLDKYNLAVGGEVRKSVREQSEQLSFLRNSNNPEYVFSLAEGILRQIADEEKRLLADVADGDRQKVQDDTNQLLSDLNSKMSASHALSSFSLTQQLLKGMMTRKADAAPGKISPAATYARVRSELRSATWELRWINVVLLLLHVQRYVVTRFANATSSIRLLELENKIEELVEKSLQLLQKLEQMRNQADHHENLLRRARDEVAVSSLGFRLFESLRLFGLWLLLFYVGFFLLAALSAGTGVLLPRSMAQGAVYSSGFSFIILGLCLWYGLATLKTYYFFGRTWAGVLFAIVGIGVYVFLLANLSPLLSL